MNDAFSETKCCHLAYSHFATTILRERLVKFHWIMTFVAVIMSLGGINDAQEYSQHGLENGSFPVPSSMPNVMWFFQSPGAGERPHRAKDVHSKTQSLNGFPFLPFLALHPDLGFRVPNPLSPVSSSEIAATSHSSA